MSTDLSSPTRFPAPHPGDLQPSLHVEDPNDTSVFFGCEIGPDRWGQMQQRNFIVLDTGRKGPDDVKIVIHENGDVTVTINGQERTYSPSDPEQQDFLRVRVDDNDNVQVEDRRSAVDKLLNPNPVQVFQYP